MTESQIKLIAEGGYNRCHINMNVPLPSSGRRAARISPSEFKDKMKKIYDDYNSSNGDDKKFTIRKARKPTHFSRGMNCKYLTKIKILEVCDIY